MLRVRLDYSEVEPPMSNPVLGLPSVRQNGQLPALPVSRFEITSKPHQHIRQRQSASHLDRQTPTWWMC